MSSNLSEKAEMNEEGPLTDEFINTLYTSKKVNNKKKMLEELISYINANPNYIIQEGTIEQFKKFLPKFTLLLNENNNKTNIPYYIYNNNNITTEWNYHLSSILVQPKRRN